MQDPHPKDSTKPQQRGVRSAHRNALRRTQPLQLAPQQRLYFFPELQAYELSNVVETALARALVLAAEAKRWDVVTLIVDELRRRGSTQLTSLAPPERLKGSSMG